MPSRDFEGVFYVKCPPQILFEDGVYHIGYDIGPRARFEVVMSQATFNKARLLADEAMAVAKMADMPKGNVTRMRKK